MKPLLFQENLANEKKRGVCKTPHAVFFGNAPPPPRWTELGPGYALVGTSAFPSLGKGLLQSKAVKEPQIGEKQLQQASLSSLKASNKDITVFPGVCH